MPLPKLAAYNNKNDMEKSLKNDWNKNDASQIQDKMADVPNGTNGTNGTNIQNGILQYAANEMSKGKSKLFCKMFLCLVH